MSINPELLIGIVLPPVIDVVNKRVENETMKFVFALAISFIVSVLVVLPQIHTGDTQALLASFGIIFTESETIFTLYWKNSFLRGKLLATSESKVETQSVNPMHYFGVSTDVVPPTQEGQQQESTSEQLG